MVVQAGMPQMSLLDEKAWFRISLPALRLEALQQLFASRVPKKDMANKCI